MLHLSARRTPRARLTSRCPLPLGNFRGAILDRERETEREGVCLRETRRRGLDLDRHASHSWTFTGKLQKLPVDELNH